MNSWLSIALLFLLSFLYSCTLKSDVKIEVFAGLNPIDVNFFFQESNDLEIFKEEEQITVLRKVILQNGYSNQSKGASLKLPTGRYTLYFESIYGRKECKEFDIRFNKPCEVVIYLDYVDFASESWTPFIDRLVNGEGYSIEFGSLGCFNGSSHFVEIWKIENEIYLTGEFDGYKFVEEPLSKNQIQAIRELEHRLNMYQFEGSCSSLDYFTIEYKCERLEVVDYTCSLGYIQEIISKLTSEKEEKVPGLTNMPQL